MFKKLGGPKLQKDGKPDGSTTFQYIIAILANIPTITYGIQIGWMSPMAPVLQSESGPTDVPVQDWVISAMATALGLGALPGTFFYGWLCDRIGRKNSVLALSIPQAISWIMKLSSANTINLIAARAVAGFAAGGVYIVIPLYVMEISQDSIRGILGCFLVFGLNAGIIVAYACGGYLSYYVNIWIYVVLPIFHCLVFWKAPESPSYLVKLGEYKKATEVLSWLRQQDEANKTILAEIENLKNVQEGRKPIAKGFHSQHLGPSAPYSLCMLILTIEPYGGCFGVISYASAVFAGADGGLSADDQALVIGVVQMVGSVLSLLVVERFGRKILFIGTVLACFLSMAVLGTWFLLTDFNIWTPSWLPLAACALAIFSYGAGIAPLPYVVMAEVFNFQTRAMLSTYVILYSWINTSVLLMFFTPVASFFGMSTLFFAFAVINLLGALCCLVYMPETRNKTVAQIHEKLTRKRT